MSRHFALAQRTLLAALLLATGPGCRRRETELHVFWTYDILSLDPQERFEFATDTFAMNVLEPLLRYDKKASFAPVLAQRWDVPDGKTWRFHLRKDVVFHDGSPLTASDVVFTFERIRRHPEFDIYPYLSGLSSVKEIDPETVEIVSDRPAGLLAVLSSVYILPRKLVEARGDKAFFEHPVGTGPYRFVEFQPRKRLVLEAFPRYRGGPPRIPRVAFVRSASSADMWIEAKSYRPSIVVMPNAPTWNEHRTDERFHLVSRPGMSVQYLMLKLTGGPKNPLSDLRVRRALRAGIDLARIVERAGGEAFPASQYVTADIIGYNPTIPLSVYQPDLAKKLLAEAGHPDGLTLTLNCGDGRQVLPDEIVKQLGEIGVRVIKAALPAKELYDRGLRCEGDLHLSGWVCSTGDGADILEGNFYSRAKERRGAAVAGCGYASRDVDDLIDRSASTMDPETRRDLLQEAMRRVVDDLPWIPLYVPYDRYATTKDVVFEPRADGEIFVADVRLR